MAELSLSQPVETRGSTLIGWGGQMGDGDQGFAKFVTRTRVRMLPLLAWVVFLDTVKPHSANALAISLLLASIAAAAVELHFERSS